MEIATHNKPVSERLVFVHKKTKYYVKYSAYVEIVLKQHKDNRIGIMYNPFPVNLQCDYMEETNNFRFNLSELPTSEEWELMLLPDTDVNKVQNFISDIRYRNGVETENALLYNLNKEQYFEFNYKEIEIYV